MPIETDLINLPDTNENSTPDLDTLTIDCVIKCVEALVEKLTPRIQNFKQTDTSKIFDSQRILFLDYHRLFQRIHNLLLQNHEESRPTPEDNTFAHQDYFVGGLMLFDNALKLDPDLVFPNCIPKVYLAC